MSILSKISVFYPCSCAGSDGVDLVLSDVLHFHLLQGALKAQDVEFLREKGIKKGIKALTASLRSFYPFIRNNSVCPSCLCSDGSQERGSGVKCEMQGLEQE